MIQRVFQPSGRSLCFAARAVALLVVFGICCNVGDVFAQFVVEKVGLGAGGSATGTNSTAGGTASTASGNDSTAFGNGASANFLNSTAIGNNASVSASNSTALGKDSAAQGFASTALGQGSLANGTSSTAVGMFATTYGTNSTAVGQDSAVGKNGFLVASGTAVGQLSRVWGGNSTALGKGSVAGVEDDANITSATALGGSSTAGFDGSTAIGYGATATRADQMMFGTATNTYTAPGITSAASRAAQTGSLQIMTTDSLGNLASDTKANLDIASVAVVQTNTSNIAQNTQDIQGLQLATEDLRQDIRQNTEGVAMAMALSGVPTILPKCTNYAVSANWGTFGGENAMAVGGSARVADNVFLNGGGALGTSGKGNSGGGRAGVTFVW